MNRLSAPGAAHPQGLRPFGSGAVQFSTGVAPGSRRRNRVDSRVPSGRGRYRACGRPSTSRVRARVLGPAGSEDVSGRVGRALLGGFGLREWQPPTGTGGSRVTPVPASSTRGPSRHVSRGLIVRASDGRRERRFRLFRRFQQVSHAAVSAARVRRRIPGAHRWERVVPRVPATTAALGERGRGPTVGHTPLQA